MTGIICAMQIEADGIIALSQNTQTEEIAGMKFTTGTLNGKDIAVVVCGVGKVNAAMCAVVLIEKFNPDVVINSGVGGSLSPCINRRYCCCDKIRSARYEHNCSRRQTGRGFIPRRYKDIL